MRFTDLLTDDAVMTELGARIAAARLGRDLTQAQLAQAAGVSKHTVERLEDGSSIQLGNLVRCLRALGLLESLERLLPEGPTNPIDLLKRRGRTRVRARAARVEASAPDWSWGDEE